uniref:Uncharacterized protein n=1 Tax=Anguilla anguilla TaxID=7936 RepID=A0A0E9VZH6_ANGAN
MENDNQAKVVTEISQNPKLTIMHLYTIQ